MSELARLLVQQIENSTVVSCLERGPGRAMCTRDIKHGGFHQDATTGDEWAPWLPYDLTTELYDQDRGEHFARN